LESLCESQSERNDVLNKQSCQYLKIVEAMEEQEASGWSSLPTEIVHLILQYVIHNASAKQEGTVYQHVCRFVWRSSSFISVPLSVRLCGGRRRAGFDFPSSMGEMEWLLLGTPLVSQRCKRGTCEDLDMGERERMSLGCE